MQELWVPLSDSLNVCFFKEKIDMEEGIGRTMLVLGEREADKRHVRLERYLINCRNLAI